MNFEESTEFTKFGEIVVKKDDCIWTCYLLCKRPVYYLFARKTQTTEGALISMKDPFHLGKTP